MRYSAFISYNHRDRKVAGWLHRTLEGYRFPRRLRGRQTEIGILDHRLPPLFRDREELSASSDLAASVREALEQSGALIVICSPNGARSQWVNEEIRAFTALGLRHRLQCLIVDGEPNASRLPGGNAERECLPPALFENDGAEPLAADIRPGQDGRTTAKLKLLAGITGLPYDELRQRELARRHKRQLFWITALGSALLVMTALAALALVSRQEAIRQRDIARRKTLTAERTVDFVKSMFAVADPSQSKGATVTAREIVDLGTARIDRELATEPTVRAELQTTLGEVYTNLGLFHEGQKLVQRAVMIPDLDAGLRARQQLALAEALSWQANDLGAKSAYERALRLANGPRSDRTDLVSRILAGLGETEGYLGNFQNGERDVRTALAFDLKRGHDGEIDVARDQEAIGQILLAANRPREAMAGYKAALEIRLRRQGELHPLAIQDLNQLGSIAYFTKDSVGAEQYFIRMLPLQQRVLGLKHPEVAVTLNNLAVIQIERRAYDKAVPLLRKAVAIQEAQRSDETSELIFPLFNLARALRGVGNLSEARQLLERDLPIAEKAKHRNLAPILVELADIDCAQGKDSEGIALIDEARPLMKKTYPDEPWRSAMLELVDSQCRRDGRDVRPLRAIILARWPRTSHYGVRAFQPHI